MTPYMVSAPIQIYIEPPLAAHALLFKTSLVSRLYPRTQTKSSFFIALGLSKRVKPGNEASLTLRGRAS